MFVPEAVCVEIKKAGGCNMERMGATGGAEMNILLLCPIDPDMPEVLRFHCMNQLLVMQSEMGPGIDIKADARKMKRSGDSLEERVCANADLRNELIADYLGPRHDVVLWMDADLIDVTPEKVRWLCEQSRIDRAVVAPLVLLEDHPGRFFDLAGFVRKGKLASMAAPYFGDSGIGVGSEAPLDMDSVGCCYAVPADVYRRSTVRHCAHPEYAEHWSVCQSAKRMGYGVYVYHSMSVTHAWLPKYGEVEH